MRSASVVLPFWISLILVESKFLPADAQPTKTHAEITTERICLKRFMDGAIAANSGKFAKQKQSRHSLKLIVLGQSFQNNHTMATLTPERLSTLKREMNFLMWTNDPPAVPEGVR